MTTRVIFSNKLSDLNKKLLRFFKMNLFNLNKVKLVFQFEVANHENSEKYIQQGIKNYPTMIHKGKTVVGVDNIVANLKDIVQKHNKSLTSKTETDRLDDFWKQTLGNVKLDENGKMCPDDDGEGADNDLNKKIQNAFAQRNETTAKTTPQSRTSSGPNTHRPQNTNKAYGSSHTSAQSNQPFRPQKQNKLERSPSDLLRSSGGANDIDDNLMAKFFENQEESM
jgi:hypothetical protein